MKRTIIFMVSNLLVLTATATMHIYAQSGGGQILFISKRDGNSEIYKMNADGSNQQRLTNSPENEGGANWSPDGRKILYGKSLGSASSQIWVMNADGTNQTLINNDSLVSYYQWSPDGQKILFVKAQTGADTKIWVMNADGSSKVQLTNTAMADHSAKWSPDGSKISFGRCDPMIPYCDLYTMNADGSNQTNLTPNDSDDDDAPQWTPDGSQIVFNKGDGINNYNLFIINADGTNLQTLTNFGNTTFALSSVISPNGSTVGFIGRSGAITTYEIYTVGTNGGVPVNLTNNAVLDVFRVWSPDGAKIAFISRRDAATDEIYTMNADGSDVVRLTFNSVSDSPTDWRFIAATPAGQNVSAAPSNNVSLMFGDVTMDGVTIATPLRLDQLQPLPFNFSLLGSSLLYDITTSAVYSGSIVVTFNVPNIASATTCSGLRILHYTNNNWDLRGNIAPVYNAANQLCTVSQRVSSLSPFVVAQSNPPANIEQCKNDGWKHFDVPRKFKNQGDCIQFVNTGK